MRSNKFKFLLNASIFAVYCSVAVAASMVTVKGRVSDSQGAAIKGAHLLFHLDTSGRANQAPVADIMRETDAKGNFNVQLESGFYDVCVMAKAFTPECRKILVSKKNVQEDFRLNADPLVIRHLGDIF